MVAIAIPRDGRVDDGRILHAAARPRDMMENPHSIGSGMELPPVSRNLERIADLATNIGEDVVFRVEGKSIKHQAEDLET